MNMQSTLPNFLLEKELKNIRWFSVPFLEVQNRSDRIDAASFVTEARLAREKIKNCKYELKRLCGQEGLSKAFYPTRFRRIYVSKKSGIPFVLPSQLNEIYPKPNKYISKKTHCNIESLKAKKNTILVTRSGTVGESNLVSKTLENIVFSDDIIRISINNESDIGFIYTFLKSKTGKLLIQNNNYGAVISHIEPEHLENIYIPYPPVNLREEFNSLVFESFSLRDESNDLIDKAHCLLKKELLLPNIEEMEPQYFSEKFPRLRNFSISFSELDNRLDGSYHVPLVKTILKHLQGHAKEVTILGDKRISEKIILPGRFKRSYVEEKKGCVFIGGKQIYELNPSNKKYLSLKKHSSRIEEELKLHENMVLVTRSGTIGKVNIVPKCWENWLVNEHVLRIFSINKDIAGYIYAWLSTDYGYELIKRFTYGAVVDEIDSSQLSQVQIPILKNQRLQQEINDLILEANRKRYEAFLKESVAMKKIEEEVINKQG